MKRHPLIPIALTLALAAACAPSPQLVTPNPVAPTLRSASNTPQRLFPVKFSVVAPADFRTQQVAPTYARLQIDGASSDATIVNGDTNGFIPITSDTTVVEAQVPEGENITVTLSTHMSNAQDSPAVATVGGVFHLNADGQLYDMEPVPNSEPVTYTEQVLADQSVRLDLPGELLALLVRQLRESAGTTENPLAPIDIETYHSFATALLNKSPLIGPELLAGVKIADLADLITTEALRVDENTINALKAQGQLPIITNPGAPLGSENREYVRPDNLLVSAPVQITHSYPSNLDAEQIPASRVLPLDFTQWIGHSVLLSDSGGADIVNMDERSREHYMYAFKPATDPSSMFGNTLTPYFVPRERTHFQLLETLAPVAGQFNPGGPLYTGHSTKQGAVYITERQTGKITLKAVNYQRPANVDNPQNIYWQIDLSVPGSSSLGGGNQYTPTVWRSKWNNTGCDCDDREIIYIVDGGKIFAVTQGNGPAGPTNQGVLLWSRDFNLNSTRAGALSADGETLYLLTQDAPAQLVAINVNPLEGQSVPEGGYGDNPSAVNYGSIRWTYTLSNTIVSQFDSVALGSDGTIYASGQNSLSILQGRIFAINPDGTFRWSQTTEGGLYFAPTVDRLPNASEDHIYTVSDAGFIYSYTASGISRWDPTAAANPKKVPGPAYPTTSTPLLAQEPDGTRVLYISRGSGLISAIRVPNPPTENYPLGNDYQLQNLWSRVPGGTVQNNLLLQDGYLYANTRSGGEGQIVRFFALKVHTPNIAQTAPWPVRFGSQKATGVSHLVRKPIS